MILTTTTKHSFTTMEHNHKGYIFTLYLFMLLCVVGNCLLFYCSCTGNCENCCGINGNESVSGSIKDKSESENENRDDKKKKKVEVKEDKKEEKGEVDNKIKDKIEIKYDNKEKKVEECKIRMGKEEKERIRIEKQEEEKKKKQEEEKKVEEEKKEENKIENKDNKKKKKEEEEKKEEEDEEEEVRYSDQLKVIIKKILTKDRLDMLAKRYDNDDGQFPKEALKKILDVKSNDQNNSWEDKSKLEKNVTTLKTSLGVNIGSLNTVYSKFGKPNGKKFQTIVLLSDVSKRVIPSQICYSPTNRLYGDTANPLMKKYYTTSYENLSRLLGFDITSPIFSAELNNFFNYGTYNNGTKKFKIANNEYVSSEVIIADYLSIINKFYFEKEKESENEKYDFVTFSVPDYFTASRKKELKLIAEAIGMKNVNIISESSAITMYYGYNRYSDMFVTQKTNVTTNKNEYVVFVDIGYSKTSFIFAKFTYNIFKVEYVQIYPQLGGRDFDNAIMEYCLAEFIKKNSGIILELTPGLKKRCLVAIQKGRLSLSSNKDVTFIVDNFYKNVDLSCNVTQETFKDIVKQQLNDFKKYLNYFKEDLINKNYDIGNLTVEMAGELMRMPILQKIAEKIFNVKISKGILIDECTSVGAALYGYYINEKLPINTFKKFYDYNYYPIVCYIQDIPNNNDNGCIQLNSEFIKKNNEIIIKCDQKYDNNTINLYTYKVNLSKLKQNYPDCANENCSLYYNISDVSKNNSFNLTYFSNKSHRAVSENIDNCIKLTENTFNIVDVKRKEEISEIIIRHKKRDAIYYAYAKAKNEISKIINAINKSNDKHKQKMNEFSQQIKNDFEDKQKEFNDYTIEGNEKIITELLYIATNMYQYFLENGL